MADPIQKALCKKNVIPAKAGIQIILSGSL